MQKITRIYVGNYGINASWYDGIIIDLTDPETALPTDALINLENGGGKTTLLSFFFSCFETPQDKFLKHLQNPNHRFSQYFSSDGRPGFIVIEWEMPARVAGGNPYRVVVGQVVSVSSRSEKPERIFFSFEVSADYALELVPGPKLRVPAADTIAEVLKWLLESQRKNHDFFYTRGQTDWQKHLQDERLLDVEMLKLQVFFSAQEGGIDTSFLTFKSESEFVHKFFDLTVDATRADAVREAVVNTCDKLAKKPHTQLRLQELQALKGILSSLQNEARQYAAAKESKNAAYQGGEGLAVSLKGRAGKLQQQLVDDAELAETQGRIAAGERERLKALHARFDAITFAQHTRTLQRTTSEKAAADEAYRAANNKRILLDAATARKSLAAAEAQRAELERVAALAAEELQPWRESVERHGANLRHALVESMTRTAVSLQQTEASHAAVVENYARLEQTLAETAVRDSNLRSQWTKLDTLEAHFVSERAHLIAEEVLHEDETSASALERWEAQVLQHAESAKRADGCFTQQGVKRETHRREAARHRSEIGGLEGQYALHQNFIGEGQIEAERLSQLPVTRLVAEADSADPESPALLVALDRLAQSSANEVALSSVRLAQLRASNASIDETGVAGQSPDVNAVVARLKENGVKSAKPFNTYIAQTTTSAAVARDLVGSNPSRFLGVCVASSELEKVKTLTLGPLYLSAPVMVSVASLEPEVLDAGCIVVPPADCSAFNFEAAQLLLQALQEKLAQEENRLGFFKTQHAEALVAKADVQRFIERFGNGKLRLKLLESEQLLAEIEIANQQASFEDAQANEAQELAEQYRLQASQSAVASGQCQQKVHALKRFIGMHETGRPERLMTLAEIEEERAQIEATVSTISEKLIGLKREQKNLEGAAVAFKQESGRLSSQYEGMKYFSEPVGGQKFNEDEEVSVEVLDALYTSAARMYEAEETSRVGALKFQLDEARAKVVEKSALLSQRFAHVPTAASDPYMDDSYDNWVARINAEIEAAELAKSQAGERHAVAANDMNNFRRARKSLPAIPDDINIANDEELVEASAEALLQQEKALAAAVNAEAFLQKLAESSRQAEVEANSVALALEMLRSAFTMPDVLAASPVPLEVDFGAQVSGTVQRFRERERSEVVARNRASASFEQLKALARGEGLSRVEPDISAQLQRNDFETTCGDIDRILEGVMERIETTDSMLNGMESDFKACVGELSNLANSAITLLMSATTKRVPTGAPWVGGMAMLKMQAKFNEVQQEARKQTLRNYLDSLIDTQVVPAKGATMVAQAVLQIYGRSLGIKLLKMSPDSDLQYVGVDKIQNSGGEAVVMAMFLYLLINQLRSETQAKLKKSGGGPLILDNPFAKATNPAMWKAQRELAAAMDVQLIFATALPDYNAVADFPRFVHLRKAGKNNKSNRWHLEVVDFTLKNDETGSSDE